MSNLTMAFMGLGLLVGWTGLFLWARKKTKTVAAISSPRMPILPPSPGIPLICPSCNKLIDASGHCACPAVSTALIDAAMMRQKQKPVKVKQYRSIDDDWSSA